jgi:outer membrane lipoprotein-sorting protein
MRYRATFLRVVWGGLLGCLVMLCAVRGMAQTLTADEIVARMNAHDRERQAALDHYESQRTYHVEYHGPMGDHSAEMQARMEFSAPDQKRFTVLSESGSPMFCHKVLRKLMDGEQEGTLEANHLRAMLSSDNDNLKLVGEDEVDGVKAWVLEVSPKVGNRFNYQGKVWVSQQDYALVRIVGSPAKNPSWITSGATFDYRYARNGEFWLPQRNVTVSHVRLGGEVTLTVDYGTYEIVAARARPAIASPHQGRAAMVDVSSPQ